MRSISKSNIKGDFKMKKLIVSLVLLFLASNSFAQFSSPESVVYDPANDRYLVSNVGGSNILQIDALGNITPFVTAPGFAVYRGMVIAGNTLFVTNFDKVMGYDLTTGQETFNLTIPAPGISSLNDIETDGNGYLYTSDMNNERIVKIHIATASYSTFVTGIDTPNGILYDAPRNRLLVCTFTDANSTIYGVSLSDSSLSTVANTPFQKLDGLTRDGNYNFYVSSWGSGEVYRYDVTFSSPPVPVATGLNGPADIYFNTLTDTLCIPVFNSNQVIFQHEMLVGIYNQGNNTADGYSLSQNFPNPFNPATSIKFKVESSKNVSLKVYNINGREVASLVDAVLQAGEYKYTFDGSNLSSGTYFYTLQTEGFTETKKMLLIK